MLTQVTHEACSAATILTHVYRPKVYVQGIVRRGKGEGGIFKVRHEWSFIETRLSKATVLKGNSFFLLKGKRKENCLRWDLNSYKKVINGQSLRQS